MATASLAFERASAPESASMPAPLAEKVDALIKSIAVCESVDSPGECVRCTAHVCDDRVRVFADELPPIIETFRLAHRAVGTEVCCL
jgi:hypothetical protein